MFSKDVFICYDMYYGGHATTMYDNVYDVVEEALYTNCCLTVKFCIHQTFITDIQSKKARILSACYSNH